MIYFHISDIDECTTNAHNCDAKADCTNTLGSFTCKCRTGYKGAGTANTCFGKQKTFIKTTYNVTLPSQDKYLEQILVSFLSKILFKKLELILSKFLE